MKKLMVLAAMLAMMLAMAAPAFAQTEVEFTAGAQNIIGEVGDINQSQYGEAEAEAEDDSAAASVDQSQDVTISQSNVFGNGFFFPFFWDWWF